MYNLKKIKILQLFFSIIIIIIASSLIGQINKDDKVVLYPAYAYMIGNKYWEININGIIYQSEYNTFKRKILIKAFRKTLRIIKTPANSKRLNRIAGLFVVDNQRGREIKIKFGDNIYKCSKSFPNGRFGLNIKLSSQKVKSLLNKDKIAGNRFSFSAITREAENRTFPGIVQFIDKKGITIISDIDDTIKISNVKNRKKLIASTFTQKYRPVPGMASLYQRWFKKDALFFYVSGSPWQLYLPLKEFLKEYGFPMGIFNMRYFRLKDSSFIDFIRAGQLKFKTDVIENIIKIFPERKYILIGDSSESDPEVYANIAKKFSGKIIAILIRDLGVKRKNKLYFKNLFEKLPKNIKWKIFRDASAISCFIFNPTTSFFK